MAEPIIVLRIETQGLILRGLTADDIPFLLDHFGKDEIDKYASDENMTNLEEAKALYKKYIASPHRKVRLQEGRRSPPEILL